MKHLLVLVLALALAGCAAVAPAAPAEAPTQAPTATPQVLIQTVVVTVIPTQQPTEIPTNTPAPTQTPQVIVVTATGQALQQGQPAQQSVAPTQPAQAAPAGPATATLPSDAFGNIFSALNRTGSEFALRCLPDTITFTASTANTTVTEVDMYYRIEDQLSTSISDWKNVGAMTSDKNGNFTIDFNAALVSPDLRSHKAWFDYQFVALNKGGGVAGRSGKIVKQVTYKIDCGD